MTVIMTAISGQTLFVFFSLKLAKVASNPSLNICCFLKGRTEPNCEVKSQVLFSFLQTEE